jgi:hypothetical protein
LENAGEIDLKDARPLFESRVFSRSTCDGARVVDQDIDPAEVFACGTQKNFGTLRAREIGLKGNCVPPNRCCRFICGSSVADDRNLRSRLC